jgi:hypothetical protein
MSQTEVVELTVSEAEVESVAGAASFINKHTKRFSSKHGVANQYNERTTEDDLIVYIAKRDIVQLQELEVSVLEDGAKDKGNTIQGKRKADLIFRINYAPSAGYSKQSSRRSP